MAEPRFSGSSTLQLSYFRHKTVPRRSPSPSIVTRPPRDAPVGPGGACCRRGSSTRSAPSPAPVRHYVPASRPCRCSGPRRHARRGPEPTNGSCCLASRARSAACCGGRLAMDPAPQPLLLQRRLDLRRAVSAVRPHTQSRVVPIQDIVEDLAVVLRRVAHMIAPHQLVPTVHVDMVLVTVMALAVLLGPPRLDILLAPLCRLVLPACRRLARRVYPCCVLRSRAVAPVALMGTATIEASMSSGRPSPGSPDPSQVAIERWSRISALRSRQLASICSRYSHTGTSGLASGTRPWILDP